MKHRKQTYLMIAAAIIFILSASVAGVKLLSSQPVKIARTASLVNNVKTLALTTSPPVALPVKAETAKVLPKPVTKNEPVTAIVGPEIPVLMYHRIDNTPDRYHLWVTVPQFAAQMQFLAAHGYHTVNLNQLEGYLLRNEALPAKPVLLTFDDGDEDVVTNALPIMRRYHFTGAMFVAGRFVGKGGAVTLSDLKTLAADGWDIENHTFQHVHFGSLTAAGQRLELEEDNAVIHQALPGIPIRYFAYPEGNYSLEAFNTLKDEGFALAFTTNHGWVNRRCNPYELPRLYVGEKTTPTVFAALVGATPVTRF